MPDNFLLAFTDKDWPNKDSSCPFIVMSQSGGAGIVAVHKRTGQAYQAAGIMHAPSIGILWELRKSRALKQITVVSSKGRILEVQVC